MRGQFESNDAIDDARRERSVGAWRAGPSRRLAACRCARLLTRLASASRKAIAPLRAFRLLVSALPGCRRSVASPACAPRPAHCRSDRARACPRTAGSWSRPRTARTLRPREATSSRQIYCRRICVGQPPRLTRQLLRRAKLRDRDVGVARDEEVCSGCRPETGRHRHGNSTSVSISWKTSKSRRSKT